jgi:integrase
MARQLERLTHKGVLAKRSPGYFADGGGLYLQVSSAGTKSWIFRYTRNGKSREMGLGPLHTVSLSESRGKAADGRRQLLAGVDPIEARKAAKANLRLDASKARTFSDCAAAYIKAHRAGWKNAKHASQWESTLETYAAPKIGALPVQAIDTGLVMSVLEPIWTTKTETASRLRARIEAILDWATTREYRTGDNPARWRGHLSNLLVKQSKVRAIKHHPALPYEAIGEFMQVLAAQTGTAAKALQFSILTAARTGEAIGARPEEFDLDKALWTIPVERMKSKRAHRVPLAPRAVEIVRQQPKGDFVFAGQNEGQPLSNMAMTEVLRRMERKDITVHGFRSTFRDWASERTSYPREVCEMALAHAIGDKTEAAYRRGDLFDKRRRLMAEWARHCETARPAGEVVKLRKGAA